MYAAKAKKQAPTECKSLVSFASVNLGVNGHSPQQDRTRRDFDEAIDSKADKGNAPGHCSCHDSN